MELYKLTAHELHDMLVKKEASSEEITKSVLKRIDDVENKVESYITLTPELALESAKIVDKKIANGEEISVLEGIPMGIKDNICTNGLKTTCASKMLNNFVPPYDAFVTKKVKAINAPILGKLNMDEFAMGSSTENSYFKKTKNPFDLNKVPGGSSGGSAASVAADIAVYSLGSDTGGSIRQPASFCGVVGMKPTYGTVSRYSLVAFASSLDQIGPLTKDVTDCALVLNAITGHDSMDSTSVNLTPPDYSKSLINNVKGLKIGVPYEYVGDGINEEVKNSILQSIEVYEKLGATVEYFNMSVAKYALPVYYVICPAEVSSNMARFDGVKYGKVIEGENLLANYMETRGKLLGKEVRRRIMLGTYVLSAGYYDAYYGKALALREILKNDFKKIFEEVDVVAMPTAPTPAFKIGEKSDNPLEMYLADVFTITANLIGSPSISIPSGLTSDGTNLPLSLQLIGSFGDDEKILEVAGDFEAIK